MKILFKSLALCAGMLGISPSYANTYALSTPTTQVHIGDYFDVDITVHDAFAGSSEGEELLGFGFNTRVTGVGELRFLGSTINPLFDDTSSDVALDAAGFSFPGLDAGMVGSSFSLATLHFQALTAGDVSLAVVGDLADFNQGLIFLNQSPLAINGSLSVNVAAVPLPPSAILFFSVALFALIGRNKQGIVTA